MAEGVGARLRGMFSRNVERVALLSLGAGLAVVALGNEPIWALVWSEQAAGWIAAIATFLAVVVALEAPERAHQNALRLSNEREQREKEERADRTAAFAYIFHSELFLCGAAIHDLIAGTEPRRAAQNVMNARAQMVAAGTEEHLVLMRRYGPELQDLDPDDMTMLLFALSHWGGVAAALPASADIPLQTVVQRAKIVHELCSGFQKLALDVQILLERYFEGRVEIAMPARIEVWEPTAEE